MEKCPSEIITHILEYLPFEDRRAAAMVNVMFYHASTHPVFLRKELLHYGYYLDQFDDFKNMLLKSRRKLLCLKINVDMSYKEDDLTIFTNLGNHIITLHFIDVDFLNDSFLDAITQCCSNLEQFELDHVMGDVILTDTDRKPILKLRSITLKRIKISDREFNLILKLAPNLKDLSIIDCNLFGLRAVTERLYPHNSNIDCSFTKYNSNKIFTDDNIVHHLNNSVRLNSLRLTHGLNIFSQIQPIQLEIKSLSLNYYNHLSILGDLVDCKKLMLLLGQYVFLEQLEIFSIPVCMLSFVSKLSNLRHLTLSYTAQESNYLDSCEYLKSLVESLKNLKYIRTLSFYDSGLNSQLKLPIYPFLECTLKSLTSIDCSLASNLELLKFGKHLTNLRIRNGEILKVEDLQLLFRNFTYLEHLRIDNCSVLNDEIFIKLTISNLKELITLKIEPSNISHRCLRHITNSRLKVLKLTNMSLESFSTQAELNEFKHSVEILSRAVPKLKKLTIKTIGTYLKTRDDLKPLMKSYFEGLKIFRIY